MMPPAGAGKPYPVQHFHGDQRPAFPVRSILNVAKDKTVTNLSELHFVSTVLQPSRSLASCPTRRFGPE